MLLSPDSRSNCSRGNSLRGRVLSSDKLGECIGVGPGFPLLSSCSRAKHSHTTVYPSSLRDTGSWRDTLCRIDSCLLATPCRLRACASINVGRPSLGPRISCITRREQQLTMVTTTPYGCSVSNSYWSLQLSRSQCWARLRLQEVLDNDSKLSR